MYSQHMVDPSILQETETSCLFAGDSTKFLLCILPLLLLTLVVAHLSIVHFAASHGIVVVSRHEMWGRFSKHSGV